MKHILFKSMSLCLLIVHCTVPAAEPGAAARASSLSPAPEKVGAIAEAARPPEAMVTRRGSGDDGKIMAEFRAPGAAVAAAAAGSAALKSTPHVFVPPVLKPMPDKRRKKLNEQLSKAARVPIGAEAEVAMLLGKGADPNARFKGGDYALHPAAAFGNMANINALLAARADVNVKDKNDLPPIFLAVMFNQVAAMRELIKHKADINCKGEDDLTIYQCAHQAYTQLALINLGLDTNAQEQVFERACHGGHVDAVRALLDRGFGVNSRMISREIGGGVTPLHVAASNGASNIVALLLARKADPHARIEGEKESLIGMSAYGCAFFSGTSKIVDVLLQAGVNEDLACIGSEAMQKNLKDAPKVKLDKYFAENLLLQRPEKFKVLQDHGAINEGVLAVIDLDEMLGQGSFLSQLVIRAKNGELAKIVAENRVSQHDLMRRDAAVMNAFLWAVCFGNVPAMRLFMEHGKRLPLSLSAPSPIGWKAKLKAKIGKKPKPAKSIPFNPFCRDEFGNSAVQLAQKRNDGAMINYLYECNARARLGVASLIRKNRIAKKGLPIADAVSNLVGEFVHGGRYVARPAPVAGLLESPKAVGGAAAAAADGRSESPKAESKESKELAKKD